MTRYLLRASDWLVLVAVLAGPAGQAAAARPSALELMKQSDTLHRIPTETSKMTMILQHRGGDKRTRTYHAYVTQDDELGDKLLIRFESPAHIRGTSFLRVEEKNRHDDLQWMYLPAFKKVRQVGASELGDRFVNSDISFEDLKRRYVEDYSYTMVGDEVVDDQPCHVIESRPLAAKVVAESPYSKTWIWLRKDNLFVVKLRAWDRHDKPLKDVVWEDAKKAAGDAWRADRITLVDVQRKHRTVLIATERRFNVQLEADRFSRHSLNVD